ncbi:MAG: alcohol dehydrogenase catalytic domain-containing protein [Chloroflexi bacterium]|nr:alcohol dehydrogenase catalytic domain-containing protein [Chloroflexota bacterium]
MAAVLCAFRRPLVIEEIEVPPLAPGQVLVAVEAAGVCGSDVHMWSGQDPRTPLPMILGHEGIGRVQEIAGEKRDVYGERVAPGDRILWERGVTCGRCFYCAVLHEPALCPSRWVYGIHRSLEVPPHLNGAYASHIVLDASTPLIPLAEDEDPATFVAASCSGATAAHGFALSPAPLGGTVVVMGPGPLGAFSVALAKAQGAEHIVVIGGTAERLALCAGLGATLLLNRHEMEEGQRLEAVYALTHGRGADLVVEASGSIAAAREALLLVRAGGAVSLVGLGAPVGEMALTPFETLVRKNVRVQGVWVSDLRHTLQALSLIRRQPAAFAALVDRRFNLAEATEALAAVRGREVMKAVLEPRREQD